MKRLDLIMAAAACVVVFSLHWGIAAAASSNPDETDRALMLFGEVFTRVRADYVDKVTDSKLIGSAINGMLTSLDPHSNYLDRKDLDDLQFEANGEFGGLGIEVSMDNGTV